MPVLEALPSPAASVTSTEEQSSVSPAPRSSLPVAVSTGEQPTLDIISTEIPPTIAVLSTEAPPTIAVLSTEAQRSGETPVFRPRPQPISPTSAKAPKIPTSELRAKDTHRLIASRYSDTGTVLSRLSSNPDTLGKLLELDDATNDRFLGEEGLLPGIGIHELVYGIRYAHIVNAAFTHASPAGGRFNTPTRGAWYASLDRETSIAEVAFHKLRQLEEIDWPHEEISTSDDYLADITSSFHDLRQPDLRTATTPGAPPSPVSSERVGSALELAGKPVEPGAPLMTVPSSWVSSSVERSGTAPANPFNRYLLPDPIPACYARPQRLAERLLTRKSNGIVYPSVRHPGGICLAVFRPALVYNVRRGARLELRLQASRPFRSAEVTQISVPK